MKGNEIENLVIKERAKERKFVVQLVIAMLESTKNGMFASRGTVDEAFRYAQEISAHGANPATVSTGLQVYVNTIADIMIATAKDIGEGHGR